MGLTSLKLLLMLVILAAAWVGGLIPLRRESEDSPRLLSWGNAFAAGIFLGIGLIHMLGEASTNWKSLGYRYPMAPLLAGGAFLVLLWLEHVALAKRAHSSIERRVIDSEIGGDPVVALYPYALLVALSVHSFILGASMGAQKVAANVGVIFFAIAAHKSTAAFALGVSLARNHVPRTRARRLVGLFALTTPIGIIVGVLVTNALTGRDQTVFDAVFLSLAAGSFIYIATFDIIRDEFLQPGPRGAKWLLAAIGFGLTGVLALWL